MPSNSEKNKAIAGLFGFSIAWFFIYAFLHESGHALIGMAYGGTVERFVFWNFDAHVVVTGADFTPLGRAMFHAAGNLFPIFIMVLCFAFYRRTAQSNAYHICHLIPIISITTGNFVGWVIIPIRTIFTTVQGEDAARFLDTTGFHPLLVALMAAILISAFITFAHAKGILRNAVAVFRSFRSRYEVNMERPQERFNPKWGAISLALALAAVGVLGVAFIVPYTPSGAAHIRLELADVREKLQYEQVFNVNAENRYTINLNVEGQGFLTGFRITDEAGIQVLGTYGESMFSVMSVTLQPGYHTVRIYFLTDWEAVKEFYRYGDALEHLVDEEAHYSFEVFSKVDADYSVFVSAVIR